MSNDHDKLRFHSTYGESLQLSDGRKVRLRLVRPEDRHHIVHGMERMSEESLYMRFMGARSSLNDSALRYLTEVDGFDHFAIGAVHEDAHGHEEGVAVARFIRVEGHPQVADFAITVIDDFQGQGLGTVLLDRLLAAARERGYERMRCDFLPDNHKIQALLAPYRAGADINESSQEIAMEFEIPHPGMGRWLSSAIRTTFRDLARSIGALPARSHHAKLDTPSPH